MIALSGLAIFFDDYANTLLVGGTMRGTADRYRISREKLAYLVDSTAAPVAGLSIVSTWAAIEISYMADGLRAGGVDDTSAAFEMFIQSIPVSILSMADLVHGFPAPQCRDVISVPWPTRNLTHWPLIPRTHDDDADRSTKQWVWLAAVLPVCLCIAAVGVVLVFTGLRAVGSPPIDMGPVRLSGEVLGNGDSYLALIVGGAVGLVSSIVGHLFMRTLLGRNRFDRTCQRRMADDACDVDPVVCLGAYRR